MSTPFETPESTMWRDAEGIVHGVYKRGAHMTLGLAQQANAQLIELSQGQPRPFLIDARAVRAIDQEARAFFARTGGARAVALLVENPLSRIIANFFLGLNRNTV